MDEQPTHSGRWRWSRGPAVPIAAGALVAVKGAMMAAKGMDASLLKLLDDVEPVFASLGRMFDEFKQIFDGLESLVSPWMALLGLAAAWGLRELLHHRARSRAVHERLVERAHALSLEDLDEHRQVVEQEFRRRWAAYREDPSAFESAAPGLPTHLLEVALADTREQRAAMEPEDWWKSYGATYPFLLSALDDRADLPVTASTTDASHEQLVERYPEELGFTVRVESRSYPVDVTMMRTLRVALDPARVPGAVQAWARAHGFDRTDAASRWWTFRRNRWRVVAAMLDIRRIATEATVELVDGTPAELRCSFRFRSRVTSANAEDLRALAEECTTLVGELGERMLANADARQAPTVRSPASLTSPAAP